MVKKITVPILKIIVSAGLILFLFYKLGFKNVLSQIADANLFWFLLSIVIFSVSNLLGSLQWQMLLKATNIHLPLKKIISLYYVGLFFNNFLVGYIGGDALRIYDVSKVGGNSANAISAVFLDRLIGFAMLTLLAFGAALYWITASQILIIIIIILLYWILLFILLFNKKLISKISWLFKYILPQKINLKMREIYLSMNALKHHKDILLKVTAISIVVQSLRILVHYTAALSIGVNLNLVYFVIFIPIIALLSSLPISIGGIGVRESSGVALFSQIWPIQSDIVAFEFFAFIIGIISTIPGGIIFMLRREISRSLTNGEMLK